MKSKIFIILTITFFVSTFAYTFSNDNFDLKIEIGWDKLATDTILIYNEPVYPKSIHDLYLDIVTRLRLTTDTDYQTFDIITLKTSLQDAYAPIIMTIVRKTFENLYIAYIYNRDTLYYVRDIPFFDFKDKNIQHPLGAYFYIESPVDFEYKVVFMLPKSFVDTDIRILLNDNIVVKP
ncbi:hypothetical protein [Thermosipho sp. 1074]|uniref:hypothetical protein n=1 Tax=Thermosipho sp. 1074 TaxID=1643331 RepID=UPI000984D59D|nr:hypothetical protein [Thermosipho sp. 1074]OOC42159.1 hypothetical protein XO08_07685 [Thermosipho sp. 1074]